MKKYLVKKTKTEVITQKKEQTFEKDNYLCLWDKWYFKSLLKTKQIPQDFIWFFRRSFKQSKRKLFLAEKKSQHYIYINITSKHFETAKKKRTFLSPFCEIKKENHRRLKTTNIILKQEKKHNVENLSWFLQQLYTLGLEHIVTKNKN